METHIRVLKRVVEIEGSEPALARRLKVRSSHLSIWLTGSEPVPEPVFLRAVDIILDATPRVSAIPLPVPRTGRRNKRLKD
jgi:hypothetical protein